MGILGFIIGLMIVGLSSYFLYSAFSADISDFFEKTFPDIQKKTSEITKKSGKVLSDIIKTNKGKKEERKSKFHDRVEEKRNLTGTGTFNDAIIERNFGDNKSKKYESLSGIEKKYVYDSIINKQRVACFNCMVSDMNNTNYKKHDFDIWTCHNCKQILGLQLKGRRIEEIDMFNFGLKQ